MKDTRNRDFKVGIFVTIGIAFAIEPCHNDPISLRLPFMARYRAAQATGRPTSKVNMASSAARSLSALAICCG